MAYELKTKENDRDVIEFIEQVEDPKKRADTYQLLDVFAEATGFPPKMWGTASSGSARTITGTRPATKATRRSPGFPRAKGRSVFISCRGIRSGTTC